MEILETIFSSDNETVEQLKGYAHKPDYKKLFFEHLGPELKKIYDSKKDKIFIKNFLEAAQYEYGFFNKEIDLPKAFELYKKYADLNDYFCMYKMHVIYLCEYEKFNVKLNRVWEKIYILKCFAYLPNYIDDWNMKLFETIDVVYEIAQELDLEDGKLEKHELFFDLLNNQRENYNLSENDISLMRYVLYCYFQNESETSMVYFSMLNSLVPDKELDYAYYTSKNKSIFFRSYLKLNDSMTEEEIEKFYKEVEEKKLYELYCDYGNYLLEKKNNADKEVIDLLTKASNEGYLFGSFRTYQCMLDFYEFDEIMKDYNKAEILLNYLLDEIVFEKLMLSQFILLTGILIKYSEFGDKIIDKYMVYVKEINDYMDLVLNRKKDDNEPIVEEEYYYIIKAYIYFFGFNNIEKQNYQKAIELLDKGNSITKKNYVQKANEFFKFGIKDIMYKRKEITLEELNKTKIDLIDFYNKNLNLRYQTIDCYIIGESYFKGVHQQKDEFVAFTIYQYGQNIFCKTILDCFIKSKIKAFLKNYNNNNNNNKFEIEHKDETCSICYINKTNKILIPCKHNICSACVEKLEKDAKCPFCRSQIIVTA